LGSRPTAGHIPLEDGITPANIPKNPLKEPRIKKSRLFDFKITMEFTLSSPVRNEAK